jgi:pyridinium-3,5-biscarboxylic acid mononucleotide sulfurtransferase
MVEVALRNKADEARRILRELDAVVVAFSGGVDSTLLLSLARESLGDRCVAVTAISPSLSARERKDAADLARRIGARHLEIDSHELDRPDYAANGPARCYHCKTELFEICFATARSLGFSSVVYGATKDDVGEFRPGMNAARERGVRAPLLEAGMGKADIRALSRALDLPTAEKPALACLASRIPFGTPVSEDRLRKVERAEDVLRDLGFCEVRVRFHGDVARIEVGALEWNRLLDPDLRRDVARRVRGAGFRFVALDVEPFRSGRLVEARDS